MNRRYLLAWISRGLATGVAAVIGLPGVQYLLGVASSGATSESKYARLMRLKDLTPGRATLVPVMGQKQDAWVRHDQQVVGRVWLVRKSGSGTDPGGDAVPVVAMSSVCPHMGCQIQSLSGRGGFQCPCHRATFSIEGDREPDPRTKERNHAPRDMDDLECRVVQEKVTGEWWVEVKYQNFETGLEHRVVSG